MTRKFGFKNHDILIHFEDIETDTPFQFNTLQTISKITSTKRKNEIIEFIFKTFIDHQIDSFRRERINPKERGFKNLLFSIKKYFSEIFGVEEKNVEELRTIISTFIKLAGLKNKEYSNFFGNIMFYKKNYKFSKMIKYVKFNIKLKKKFISFLDNNYKRNIF